MPAGVSLVRREQSFYITQQGRDLILDRTPDQSMVDEIVAVDEGIAKSDVQTGLCRERVESACSSRGGELALLLGATYSRIRAVVAYVPSGIVWPSFPPTGHSAWTLGGKEAPYANVLTYEQWDRAVAQGLAKEDSLDWYLIPLRNEAHTEAARMTKYGHRPS